MFKDSNLLEKAIEAIKTKFGGELKGLSANAKDANEKSEEYDLLQENFTKTVKFERDDIENLHQTTLRKSLLKHIAQINLI